jgi:hypothetical protein
MTFFLSYIKPVGKLFRININCSYLKAQNNLFRKFLFKLQLNLIIVQKFMVYILILTAYLSTKMIVIILF